MLTTRLNLSSQAGKSLRFRYRIGTDSGIDNLGWFIDDMDIYTCANPVSYQYLPVVIHNNSIPLTSFHSNFNGSSVPWVPLSGNWTTSSIHYTSEAYLSDKWFTSSYSDQAFSNFSFTARMKRVGCENCASRITVRGSPFPLAGDNDWNNAYSFNYSANGNFSVWKILNGSYIQLVPWTTHTAIFKGEEWNVFKIIVIGNNLQFYINSKLVWSGSDATFSTGRIGMGMYHATSPWDILSIDWAQLSTITSLASEIDQTVIPGMVVSGGNPMISP